MRGAVVVLCTLPAPRIAPQGAGAAALDADITPAVLVQMNALRRQNGLATLERVPLLDTAAARRAVGVAALPRATRLASRRDIREVLQAAGVHRIRRATE